MLTIVLSLLAALAGLLLAGFLGWKIMQIKTEDNGARVISAYIRKGAWAFLTKEYFLLAGLTIIGTLLIGFWPGLSWPLAMAFFVGALFSALAGLIGLQLAISANVAVAEKLNQSLSSGLHLVFITGSVIGLAISGLGILGLAGFYFIFQEPVIIFGFGLGASLSALFIRLGGGIFTKAADIGADLVGKMENNWLEDDPRNPLAIANSVGDNVGDVAGWGADLFESYVDAIIVTMVLGALFLPLFGSQAIILPLIIAGWGLIISALSVFALKFLKQLSWRLTLNILNISALFLMALGSFIAVKYLVGDLKVWGVILIGLLAGWLIELSTKYYTSVKYKPVQFLAHRSQSGTVANIFSGLVLGFLSLMAPVAIMILTIYFSYQLAGLYGLALSAVSLLSLLGFIFGLNIYGPMVDNAAAIAQMAKMGSFAKERAQELDADGNVNSAVGKSLAVFSSTLTALALLACFGQIIGLNFINLIDQKTFIGLLLGGLLPFIFSGWLLQAVDRVVSQVVKEAKRQFKENSGLLTGQAEPDYNKGIDIATLSSLKQMIGPGLLAIIAPILIGVWLGVLGLAGFITGSILVGFMLGHFMISAGAAWDNAKKFIEDGHLGGSGGTAHQAALIGDALGDPLKDTIGPSLNILIKLMAIISIIILPLLML